MSDTPEPQAAQEAPPAPPPAQPPEGAVAVEKPDDSKPLSPKELAFAQNFAATRNGLDSYRRAGYRVSSTNAGTASASRLLGRANVQREIANSMARILTRAEVSADDVVQELARLAFSDIGDIIDLETFQIKKKLPPGVRRTISKVKIKYLKRVGSNGQREIESIEFTLWNKVQALHDLCAKFGLLDKELTLDKLLDKLGPLGLQLRAMIVAFKDDQVFDALPPPRAETPKEETDGPDASSARNSERRD